MPGKIACGRSEGLYFRVNFCIGHLGVVCRYVQFILCERVWTGNGSNETNERYK
jgi:hypothetical protein